MREAAPIARLWARRATELRAAEQLTFGGFLALSKLDSQQNVTAGGLAAALWSKPRARSWL
jgi:hypothetical protein